MEENINPSHGEDAISSGRVQVKMENFSDGSTGVTRNTSGTTSISNQPFSSDFQFKTPSPVCKQNQSSTSSKHMPSSLTSKLQSCKVEPSLESPKSNSSIKKKPAVKIASFAKASPVDRLAPSPSFVDPTILTKSLEGTASSMTSHLTQNTSGASKQPMTQTSLPTPALNAALRSLFNFNPQSPLSTNESDEDDDEEDEEDEDVEEEEILVYMQFDSKLDSDLLQPHTPFKIIGVDSEKPVLQLGNQVFEGNWNDTVGTAVFFEENPIASTGDPVFMKAPPITLNYHSKTQKALVMSRIFVKPKTDNDEDNNAMVTVDVAPSSTE